VTDSGVRLDRVRRPPGALAFAWGTGVMLSTLGAITAGAASLIRSSTSFEESSTVQVEPPARPTSADGQVPELRYRGYDWNKLAEQVRETPELRALLVNFESEITKILSDPVTRYRRPLSLSEIDPSQLDTRYKQAGDNGELFALAMADCGQGDYLRTSGVALAMYTRLLKREDCLAKCIAILSEFANHAPLQRPGWTAYSPTAHLNASGDGVWLGTAWGIEGVVEMSHILGDSIPEALRIKLRDLLRRELAQISQDWQTKRPWYVAAKVYQTNQWIEPLVAAVRASLFIGEEGVRQDYDLAVSNLGLTLDTLGSDGAFLEGVTYGSMTEPGLFDGIGLIRATGDTRLDRFAFVGSAWKWWFHMALPGQQFVNCFDSRMSVIPPWALRTPLRAMHLAAKIGGSTEALRHLRYFYPDGNESVNGIQYLADVVNLIGQSPSIPTYAFFNTQQLVVWRSEWQSPSLPSTAWSIWIRGGSLLDSHSHRDQGHVSIQSGSIPILIECGSPDYSTEDYDVSYASAAGHNVFQVGELKPRGQSCSAPISISRLGDTGGDVSVDCAKAFPSTKSLVRNVQWDLTGRVIITDTIRLKQPVLPGQELLRYHTGLLDALAVTTSGSTTTVDWSAAQMRITSSPPVGVRTDTWPDAVQKPFRHQVVSIYCQSEATEFEVRTEIQIKRSASVTTP